MMENSGRITFTKRPISIFPSYRPMYRVCLNLMVLKMNCNGGKGSLLKLHLFSWALKSEENMKKLQEYFISDFTRSDIYFGIEPTLNRALDYAIAENLIGMDGAKYFIKTKGEELFKKIIADKELFSNEKSVLVAIGKNISEAQIIKLQKNWSNA